MRSDGRKADELRPIKITRNYLLYPEGSVLIEQGNTKIIVTASVEEQIPRFMRDSNNSWITAEYNMLPRATDKRTRRPSYGKMPGRSIEIQRLIGRSLRGAFELNGIGECSIRVDCDVIQADGGTRCASITGGFVAVFDALRKAYQEGIINKFPDYKITAAISAGILNEGTLLLDLPYEEDSKAEVDANFVINEDTEILEIQGTSERKPFNKKQLMKLLDLAEKGIKELIDYQKKVLEI
ncbi:MAG: ribonuclease PH [Promethearchaeota archaeon]